jgi:hypothetical protein
MYSWTDVAARTLRVYDDVMMTPWADGLLPRLRRCARAGPWAGPIWCCALVLLHWWWVALEWWRPAAGIERAPDWPLAAWGEQPAEAAAAAAAAAAVGTGSRRRGKQREEVAPGLGRGAEQGGGGGGGGAREAAVLQEGAEERGAGEAGGDPAQGGRLRQRVRVKQGLAAQRGAT